MQRKTRKDLLVYRAPDELFRGSRGRLVSLTCLPYGSRCADIALRDVDWVDIWEIDQTATVVDSRIVNGVLMRGGSRKISDDCSRKAFIQVRLPRIEEDQAGAEWMAKQFYGGDRIGYLVQGGRLALQEINALAKGVGLNLTGAAAFAGRWCGAVSDVMILSAIIPTWASAKAVDMAGNVVADSEDKDHTRRVLAWNPTKGDGSKD